MWNDYLESHVLTQKTKFKLSRTTSGYGTIRVSEEQYQKWRLTITEKNLLVIENDCQESIKKLNYRIFGNIDSVRNLNISLFLS